MCAVGSSFKNHQHIKCRDLSIIHGSYYCYTCEERGCHYNRLHISMGVYLRNNNKCIQYYIYSVANKITLYHMIQPCFWWAVKIYKSLYHSIQLDFHTQCIAVIKIKCNYLTTAVSSSLRLIPLQLALGLARLTVAKCSNAYNAYGDTTYNN